MIRVTEYKNSDAEPITSIARCHRPAPISSGMYVKLSLDNLVRDIVKTHEQLVASLNTGIFKIYSFRPLSECQRGCSRMRRQFSEGSCCTKSRQEHRQDPDRRERAISVGTRTAEWRMISCSPRGTRELSVDPPTAEIRRQWASGVDSGPKKKAKHRSTARVSSEAHREMKDSRNFYIAHDTKIISKPTSRS